MLAGNEIDRPVHLGSGKRVSAKVRSEPTAVYTGGMVVGEVL